MAGKGKGYTPRYILFSEEEHEKVALDVTYPQVDKFILLWNEGFSINTIYRKVGVHKVTAALMAMDLEMTGRLKARRNGVNGWRFDCEFDEWWKNYKENKNINSEVFGK